VHRELGRGHLVAQRAPQGRLPIGVREALELRLLVGCLAADEATKPLAAYRAEELARMQGNFYGFDPSYHVARHHFVARNPQAWTSRHLAAHRLR
jgi:hypothetical protein